MGNYLLLLSNNSHNLKNCFTMDVTECSRIKPMYDKIIECVEKKYNTMIEVPRTALTSVEMAKLAEFYSFCTNDLHKMTLGLSRDDSEGSFLQNSYECGIIKDSPSKEIDQNGVMRLMKITVKDGRKVRPELTVGICGEDGGNPRFINFCHRLCMNYV